MIKELTGWLDVRFDDTALYESEEKMAHGNPYSVQKLTDQIEEFDGKKVRITIEVID